MVVVVVVLVFYRRLSLLIILKSGGSSTLPTNYSSCMTKLEDHLHPPDVYSYIPLVYPNVLTKIDQHTVKMSVQAEGPSAGGGGGSGGGGPSILQETFSFDYLEKWWKLLFLTISFKKLF